MVSTTFLFWNLNGKALEERVSRIVRAWGVQVALLVEVPTDFDLSDLEHVGSGAINRATRRELRIYSGNALRWTKLAETSRHLVYQVLPGGLSDMALLALAHLPSKLAKKSLDQHAAAQFLAEAVDEQERRFGTNRSLIVGDFNMNPFEDGLASAHALHALPFRSKVAEDRRQVQERSSKGMCYNPMWGLWGDRTSGPPGTYYRSSSDLVNFFWNMYDQVLLRPGLMDCLERIEILESDSVQSLLTSQGLPDKELGSDHLPVLFRLNW